MNDRRSPEITMTHLASVYRLRPQTVFVLFAALDVLFVGIGMGVPIINIVFGFVVGWYLIMWITIGMREPRQILRQLLTTVFAGHLTLLSLHRQENISRGDPGTAA